MDPQQAHDELVRQMRQHMDGVNPPDEAEAAAGTMKDDAPDFSAGEAARVYPTMDLSGGDSAQKAASLRRGRAAVSVTMPTDAQAGASLTRTPNVREFPPMDLTGAGPTLTDDEISTYGDKPDAPIASSPSTPRGAMLSAVTGAAKSPPPTASPSSMPPGAPQDTELAGLQAEAKRQRSMGQIGQAVTAYNERPTNQLDAIQQLAHIHPSAAPHSTLWDNPGAEGDKAISDLKERRASSATMAADAAKNDPNGNTANVYRSVLGKFMPGTDLSKATPAQMEKIAPWLESYAKTASEKKKAENPKPDELPSLKANLKLAYPSKAAEIDSLGSAKAAEDFRLINEGRLGRDTSIQAARIAADAARGEARTVRGEVKEDKQTEEAAKQALPGYVHDPKVQVSPTETAAMRDGVAESRSMSQLIDELDGMVAKNGIKVWPDADKVAMQSTMRQLQLKAKGKAFAELGVLSGPDLALLEQLTGDPTDIMSNFKGGAEGVRKRLQVFKGVLNNGVAEKLRSKGYSPEGGAIPAGDGMEHRTLSSGLKAHRKPGGEWEVDDGP